jgi:hypothetical protein
MNRIAAVIRSWLPLAAVISLTCGLIYVSVQQIYRSNANDPQIQMAEDIARALADGQAPEGLLPAQRVDISQSLAPYVIIFDNNGGVVASNARLHGQVPEIPAGVLEYAGGRGQDRVTYQPEPGVRSATVTVAVPNGPGGYVLAGRSLREVEARVDRFGLMLGLGWLGSLAASLVLAVLIELVPFTRSQA